MGEGTDGSLWNPDLAPTGAAQRNWAWYHFAALWVGMIIAVPSWMLASGLIEQGMSAMQAAGTVLLGNLIILAPLLLIGHAGARYGVPFAVLARASFGTRGARLPALARALVACGWYGIQTWIGGEALLTLLGIFLGADLRGAPLPVLDIGAGQLAAFLIFWLVQIAFLRKGIIMIRRLESWTAPLKLIACFALLWWAVDKAGGLGPIFTAPSAFAPGGPKAGQFWAVFWPSLTAMVGFWGTLALNIPDFTRFARSQRDQMIGQAGDFIRCMADIEDGNGGQRVKLGDHGQNFQPPGLVQRSQRFVQQQALRVRQQGAADCHPLGFSAGE